MMHKRTAFISFLCCMASIGCKKLVEIPPPSNSITTSQTFSDSADANSAVTGIYNGLRGNGDLYFGCGGISLYTGTSSDELLPYLSGNDQFSTNTLLSSNSILNGYFWDQAYAYIYQANAVLEGLPPSNPIADAVKKQLTAEAKFLRAYCYFYLVNLFGDVPYVTSTAWAQTSSSSRTPAPQVFQSVITDLLDAQAALRTDYSVSSGERTRANQWAATALLARAYLYTGDFAKAETQSTNIINNTGLFKLVDSLNLVFQKNSTEAILQWQTDADVFPYNATTEGDNDLPYDGSSNPEYILSNQLLNAFEAGDKRRTYWVDSTNYGGGLYYYPYKYKIGPSKALPKATTTEYYMVLRLAEQFLIRAEARAQQDNLGGAIADLNIIRARAKLTALPTTLDKTGTLAAIAQERRIELFAEWGHRWLDLKRTGQLDAVMKALRPTTWQSFDQLYPIPSNELHFDPNLVQNPGYIN
jgi:hypothetical protein